MPLFMVLSGYVSSSIIIGKGDIVRKFRQLIIPCISLAIICYIISFDENFWYLKSLFLCYVLWLFYFRINIKFKLVLFVISCFVLFPLICYIPYLSSYKVDFMLPFFGLGLLLHRCSGFIECKIKKILIISCLLFVLCEIIWDPQFIWYNSRPSWINFKEIYVNHVLSFNLYNLCLNLFRFFTGAIASLFFIAVFQLLYNKNNTMLLEFANLGKYSLHVYILQAFIVRFGMTKFPIYLPNYGDIFYYVITLIVSCIIAIFCVIMAKILEKKTIVNKYIFGKF